MQEADREIALDGIQEAGEDQCSDDDFTEADFGCGCFDVEESQPPEEQVDNGPEKGVKESAPLVCEFVPLAEDDGEDSLIVHG